MEVIKRVVDRLYDVDLLKCSLLDGYEIISDEFVDNLSFRNVEKGFSFIPYGYKKGLFFKANNGAEIYNNPKYLPDIVNFGVMINGLKKDSVYKLTIICRNIKKYNLYSDDVQADRVLLVKNSLREVLINRDLSENLENIELTSVFKANSTEENLSFQLGKIAISKIYFDEIELLTPEKEEEPEIQENEYEENKLQMVSYGIFSMNIPNGESKRKEMIKLSGKGISLFYNEVENAYTIERDNADDLLNDLLTNSKFIIDINTNKMINTGQNSFSHYAITEVSQNISPNTLKGGYYKFQIMYGDEPVKFDDELSRLVITVNKIY